MKFSRACCSAKLMAAALMTGLLILCSCISDDPARGTRSGLVGAKSDRALQVQALVLGAADEYIAALGEAVYLTARSGEQTPKARALSQMFVRNGTAAALDIATDPNPLVAMLDLMVLSSLQVWAFETHWIPAGIGDSGTSSLQRMKAAEAEVWKTAGSVLTGEQVGTVKELVDSWIAQNPDRTITSRVRFEDFADARMMNTLNDRGRAAGLLQAVSEAAGAVDDARLLGERALWYASRYPLLLGQQTELTVYRLAEQPEVRDADEALKAVRAAAEAIQARLHSLREDLQAERTALFEQIAGERRAAINEARVALEAAVDSLLKNAESRLATQREAAIRQFFESFSAERKSLLDDIEARQATIRGVMNDLKATIESSNTLAAELTRTVGAIDRVVSRFDSTDRPNAEPLKISDVRDVVVEAGKTADRISAVLERTNELADSRQLDQRFAMLAQPGAELIDRIFWRGVVLIALLVGGLACLKLIPARVKPVTT